MDLLQKDLYKELEINLSSMEQAIEISEETYGQLRLRLSPLSKVLNSLTEAQRLPVAEVYANLGP